MEEDAEAMPPTITFNRRAELSILARETAMKVMEQVKAHERCLFRRMVEQLMPGED